MEPLNAFAFEQVLVHPGSPLDESVSKMSQVYGLMCSAKEALEHDIKTLFLNPLYVFLDKVRSASPASAIIARRIRIMRCVLAVYEPCM